MVYGDLENNSEVMDVLYAIIHGCKTPKEIVEKLKQNDSTIRSKLLFLRKNDVVLKDKWNYEAKWDVIYQRMLNAINDVLAYYISVAEYVSKRSAEELRMMKKDTKVYFPKKLILEILRVYSLIYFHGYRSLSMYEMMRGFLDQLPKTNDVRIKEINPKLLDVKKVLKDIPTPEEFVISKL